MGRPESKEMLVLGFDCIVASNSRLARLRPVIQVEHASSGNVNPLLGLPPWGQKQVCVCAWDDVGSPFVISFSGSASASRHAAVICDHVDVCTCDICTGLHEPQHKIVCACSVL